MDPTLWARLLQAVSDNGPWPLVLMGGVGVGKTCAALCLLDCVRLRRRYVTTADMVRRITAYRMGQEVRETESQWFDHWLESACVGLDELGSRERVSDAHYEIVKEAIDLRNDRPMVVCTNHNMDMLAAVYDDRVVSRLSVGTIIDMFGWPDRRNPKGGAA